MTVAYLILLFQLSFVTQCSLGASIQHRRQIPLSSFPAVSDDLFNWNQKDGSFRFGMQGNDQWRVEKRTPDGKVYVRYAYRTPDGQIHDYSFERGGQLKSESKVVEESSDDLKSSEDVPSSSQKSGVNEDHVEESVVLRVPMNPGKSTTRSAQPYGALASVQSNDFEDSNSIVDEEVNAVVLNLNNL